MCFLKYPLVDAHPTVRTLAAIIVNSWASLFMLAIEWQRLVGGGALWRSDGLNGVPWALFRFVSYKAIHLGNKDVPFMRSGVAHDNVEDPVLFCFSAVHHSAFHAFAESSFEISFCQQASFIFVASVQKVDDWAMRIWWFRLRLRLRLAGRGAPGDDEQ